MAGRLIGAWNPALDANGEPISGAKLYTYQAGTTTPKTTYQDAGLTTPQTNPIIADSAGRFPEIWAADGATYDLKWTDSSNVQIELFQNIQSLGSTASGAVTRDFGADGRFNLESRGGVFEIEAGDPAPDNQGGTTRIGGWAGTTGDTLTLDFNTVKVTGALSGTAQRGGIGGLKLSTAGGASIFGVAVGQATDNASLTQLVLPSAFTKSTSIWAVGTGNGALDTGTINSNTWYHVFLIRRPDSGLVDVLVSTSPTAPMLPTGYTQLRRIGALRTDSSLHWIKFIQLGDLFLWNVPTGDVNAVISTIPLSFALTVPQGISVEAIFSAGLTNASGAVAAIVYSPLQAAQSNTTVVGNFNLNATVNGQTDAKQLHIVTDTNRQIAVTANASGATLYVATQGWIDTRGKDD